jgi:hypothetical protein
MRGEQKPKQTQNSQDNKSVKVIGKQSEQLAARAVRSLGTWPDLNVSHQSRVGLPESPYLDSKRECRANLIGLIFSDETFDGSYAMRPNLDGGRFGRGMGKP